MQKAQIDMDKAPHDAGLKAKEATILNEYKKAIDDEEKLLFQKAKVDWLCGGDMNTKYFHQLIRSTKHTNRILSICDEEGNRAEGKLVVGQFVNHFKKFLGVRRNTVSIHDLSLFTKKLSSSEAQNDL